MTTPSTKRTSQDQAEHTHKHDENTPLSQIEGRHPVAEALRAGRHINRVFVLESARTSRRKSPLAELAQQCRDQGAIVVYVGRATLDKMALSEGHQGIIAEMAAHGYRELDDVLHDAATRGETPFLLLIDHVQDPQNLGSILRIADGAGVTAVIIPKRQPFLPMLLSPKLRPAPSNMYLSFVSQSLANYPFLKDEASGFLADAWRDDEIDFGKDCSCDWQ